MIKKQEKIALFEGKRIRRHWDDEKELWYFSVVDVIAVLTSSDNPQVYWRVLKKRLIDEGSNETVTKCNGLKMTAADGKRRSHKKENLQDLRKVNRSQKKVELLQVTPVAR